MADGARTCRVCKHLELGDPDAPCQETVGCWPQEKRDPTDRDPHVTGRCVIVPLGQQGKCSILLPISETSVHDSRLCLVMYSFAVCFLDDASWDGLLTWDNTWELYHVFVLNDEIVFQFNKSSLVPSESLLRDSLQLVALVNDLRFTACSGLQGCIFRLGWLWTVFRCLNLLRPLKSSCLSCRPVSRKPVSS